MIKTSTKTANVDQVRKANQSQLERVCEILGWDLDQYTNYQFDQYTAFITRSFAGFPVMLKQVLYSDVMRGMWNNEVEKRNRERFLPFAEAEVVDTSWVDRNNKFCFIPALPYGDRFLVDEFYSIHDSQSLKNNDAFMYQFNNTLKLIR